MSQRSTGRSTVARIQRAELSAGRPPGQPGPFPESRHNLAVDRPILCTSVHVGRPFRSTGSLSGRPVGRPPESFCSLESPGRPGGRPAESSALCIHATVDRLIDRWLNGQKSDRWPVDWAVDRQVILAVTTNFWSLFKGGFGGCFKQDFKVGFEPVFPNLLSVFSPLV